MALTALPRGFTSNLHIIRWNEVLSAHIPIPSAHTVKSDRPWDKRKSSLEVLLHRLKLVSTSCKTFSLMPDDVGALIKQIINCWLA